MISVLEVKLKPSLWRSSLNRLLYKVMNWHPHFYKTTILLTVAGRTALVTLEIRAGAGKWRTDDRVTLHPAVVAVTHGAWLRPTRPLGAFLVETVTVEAGSLLWYVGITVDVVDRRNVVVRVVGQTRRRNGNL